MWDSRRLFLAGREAECGQIARLMHAAHRSRGSMLVLSGEAGIGKSAICNWALADAETAGLPVLSISGVEAEANLPFAGLVELFATELDHLDALPEPQAVALKAALARRAAPQGHRLAIGAAVMSLLAVVAERAPLLVVVDDAQWVDAASTEALLFAARRLRREAVAFLVATLPGSQFDQARRAGIDRLELSGLPESAAFALLRAAHGNVSPRVAKLITESTEGNPLALLEIPRLLSGDQLAGRRPIEGPLPVGPTLEHAFLLRVSGLAESTRKGLLVAAASGARRLQPVIDALRDLGLPPSALDAAERANLISVSGGTFSFRHPLLRSAIYHSALGPERRAAHTALGRVVPGELGVWHLAQATVGEDEAVARQVEQIGMDARRRGAPAAAASALERAARLSPHLQRRVARLTEAARAYYTAGQPNEAMQMLDEAFSDCQSVIARADIQHLRGRILVMRGHADVADRMLAKEAELVREVDPARCAAMLSQASLDRLSVGDIRDALETARKASAVAPLGAPAVKAVADAMLATALILNGKRPQAQELLTASLAVLGGADPLTEAAELITHAAHCFSWLERYDISAALLDRLISSARRASAPATLPWPLTCRAELDFRLGRWAVAAAEAEEALLLSNELGQDVISSFALDCLTRLDAVAGHEHRARTNAARALTLIGRCHIEPGRTYIHSSLGLLELGLGHIEPAIQHLDTARALSELHGLGEPGVVPWHADHIEALVRAGRHADARTAIDEFANQADQAGSRWALGTAARCRALLAEEAEAEAAFAVALEHLGDLPAPFEVARTHLCHGERLRREGRRTEARHALRQAIEGFAQLGAHPWLRRAESELHATGAAPRRRRDRVGESLTAQELQVALAVANGATNREAAAELFLSPKTIEFHLMHIYRKLGVRTRSQLAGLAAERGWLSRSSRSAQSTVPSQSAD
ncbi:ATP-binding protein [Micromonospora sp. DT47]|uniref:ATP-binding protein n=1 Tax=Micromonospora sp. DT47 TaxID=3393431 RepID=UPI003CF425D2